MPSRSYLRPGRTATGYLAAFVFCLTAAAGQFALEPLLAGRFPLALFPIAVIGAAWYGNFGPGLFATIVSAVIADLFFLEPIGSPAIHNLEDIVGLLIFVFAGLLVSTAVRHLRLGLYAEHDIRLDTERRLLRTGQIQDLTTALSRARTPKDVIEGSLPELLHAVDAAAGAVIVASDRDAEFEVVHAVGYRETDGADGYRVSLSSQTLLTEAIRRHELMARGRRNGEAASLALDPFLGSYEAAVILPLLTGGRSIGAVTLSFAGPHDFADDEREFLLDCGRRTAQALERARLYDMAERARVEAEDFRVRADIELRERQRMEAALRSSEGRYRALAARTNRLYSLSASLSESVTVDAVARATVEQGKLAVGASAGSIALFNGTEFETIYGAEYFQGTEQRFPAESGLCATAAVETRRPVFVGSFSEWQDHYPRSASMVADGGFASSAALPLLVDGIAIGVLSFYFTAPVNFDGEYQPLLTSVATHCAQALDRARLYEAAQRARAEAEAANRSKDDFVSTVSHELRTPLNAILGWASMLRDGSLDPKRGQRAIESIFTNATRQARLVDELLDVSRIIAGRTSLDLQHVDLAENVRGAVEAVMPIAEGRGVELKVGDLPVARVMADPRRLEQVFLNLLANAVKFTPSGGRVVVNAEIVGAAASVRVIDTGRGIEPEFLPHVFERFRQADSSTGRTAGGLGLGLFIARHLVEAHHGEIRVESGGADKGATFIVTLPLSDARVSADHVPNEPMRGARKDSLDAAGRLAGVRVLLVDDESDAREVMASALEASGATVTSAASARDALDALAARNGGIDVLLADIAMPGEDGYQLIQQVRAQPIAEIASIPAAAVTACARDDERRRALAAGFQMHLAKPLAPAALVNAVAELAAGQSASLQR